MLTSIASRLLLPLLLLPMPAAGADKITFDDHVFPVFEQACLNCHNPDKAKGGLDLSTFGATLKGGSGGKIVDAGDTGAKLIAVMTHSAEPKMPPEGDKVAADKIALLKQWIEGGLLENKSSSARKPTKPKFDVAMGGNPTAKPEGPPPMPEHLLLEPVVAASRGTAVRSLAASPWAPLLATTSQQQVLLYNTDNLRLAAILPFPAGDPVSLAFTPDGRYLIAGGGIAGKSGTTVTWDVKTGEIMLQAGKEFDSVLAADLRPDFGAVATGSPSRLLKLWNSADGEMAASIKKHTDWITALDYTPDGVLLASGDRNGGVWAWEAQAGAEFHTLRAHQARITGLVFRADSNVLASASEDGTVRFWEMNGGNEIKKVDAHGNGVLGFSWARDGSFATIGRDRKIKTWKPDFNLRKEMTLESALPTCVALAADGSKVFVGDYDGEISVWHAAEGKRLGSMPSNPPTISSRLATLRERIRTHPQAIAGAEAGLAEARKKLEAARKQLADAEAIAKQKQEAHQQARREETQWKKRIETLDAKIAQLDRKSKSLTTGRDQAKAEVQRLAPTPGPDLEKAKQQAAELEKQLAAANHELAETRAEREPLPAKLTAATKAAEAAEAAIDPARKAVDPKRKAAAPAEQAVAAATKALEAAKDGLPALQQEERFWLAAEVNANAIRKRAQAGQLASEFDILATDYAAAAKEVEQRRAAVNEVASRRLPFARALSNDPPDPALAVELASVLDTLDFRLAQRRADLAESARKLIALSRQIDKETPARVAADTEARTLQARYQSMQSERQPQPAPR